MTEHILSGRICADLLQCGAVESGGEMPRCCGPACVKYEVCVYGVLTHTWLINDYVRNPDAHMTGAIRRGGES